MELELTYDDETAIPEGFKDLYTERDGKWHFTAIKMPNTSTLETTLRKVRADLKAANEKLAKLKDIDPDTIHDQLSELEELRVQVEAGGGKPDDAKVAQLVEAQVTRRTAKLQRENEDLKSKLTEAESRVSELETGIKRGKITEAARAAAAKAKIVPEAIDDVILYAERLFEVGDDGSVTARDGVGVTPGIDIDAWLIDRQKDRPHWFPRSTGGGGKGSDGRGGGPNPWTKGGWNLTEQGRIIKERGREVADQMAKAAGSSVGATKPPAQ